ncbi:MAG: response regulator transcription factor [Bacteroidales bacterium]|nr:response regulator transcription factor [Bacteroidales bacterium]
MIRVIAIDDEPLALRQLEMYIAKVPFLELVAACSSANQAKPYLDQAEAVFLDINMPDLSGMDFIKSLPHPPAVVFTTAYSEFAVEGFRVNAVDYLLKPFSFKEFETSCGKLREQLEMKAALAGKEADAILHVKADYRTVSVDTRKIVYIESWSEYIKIHLVDEEVPVIALYSLKNLIDQLPKGRFMRIHRSYIIALGFVAEASRTRVRLRNGITLPVGEQYRPAFGAYLASI